MHEDGQKFGDFLREQISQAKITQFAFYTAIGITKPYFYDILSGKAKPPPLETQYRMIAEFEKIFGVDENRRNILLNKAAEGRNEIPADISELIYSHPNEWDTVRTFLKQQLTDKR